jgi:hypothetical protein
MTQPAEERDAAPDPGEQPLLNARLLGPMLVTLNGRRVERRPAGAPGTCWPTCCCTGAARCRAMC